jgi:hypothetical protein
MRNTTITREHLIRVCKEAAENAELSGDHTTQIVDALSDPAVKYVARESYSIYDEANTEYKCPVNLAGLFNPEPGTGFLGSGLMVFATNFDRLTREYLARPGRELTLVIEVTD